MPFPGIEFAVNIYRRCCVIRPRDKTGFQTNKKTVSPQIRTNSCNLAFSKLKVIQSWLKMTNVKITNNGRDAKLEERPNHTK